MTMVHEPRCRESRPSAGPSQVARMRPLVLVLWLGVASVARGQTPGPHYPHHALMPPGAIGSAQLERGGPLPGYFQPVEITAPTGAVISLAADGAFTEPLAGPVKVGMLIAPVYRLRVSNLSFHPGREVYPTIEVIDRLYPPSGAEKRFPIPVDLNNDDIRLALDGRLVTRVIYVEDSHQALPATMAPGDANWFDAGPGANALEVADRLGRPVAILRMGGRVPDLVQGPDQQFLGGCPPLLFYHQQPGLPAQQAEPAARRPLQVLPAGSLVSETLRR